MREMNIWEILQIEPTTDKKQIRRAYAARSKVIHPEEKPEEFQTLYEAYQQALACIEHAGAPVSHPKEPKREVEDPADSHEELEEEEKVPVIRLEEPGSREWFPENEPEEPEREAEEDLLSSYFEKNLKDQEQKLARFMRHWPDLRYRYHTAAVKEWWNPYLRSEEFQEIKWHPRVLAAFTEAINWNLKYQDEFLEILWEAYDLKDDRMEYEEDAKKLCQFLRSEHERRVFVEIVREKNERQRRFWKKVFVAFAILLCLAAPFLIYAKRTEDRRYVAGYMEKHYPNDVFSKPEKGKTEVNGDVCYELHSENYPDFQITVRVSKQDGIRSVEENYGSLLLNHYAEQYQIPCGWVETKIYSREKTPVLYYPSYDQIDPFCGLVETMFREQEELAVLDEVGICLESALFPEVIVKGKEVYSSLAEEQVYTPGELTDASSLSGQIQESCLAYMFNYETWNLTDQELKELGPVYETMCMDWEDKRGSWCDLYVDGEKVCQVFISVYAVNVTESLGQDPAMRQTLERKYTTIGNAWMLFQVHDVKTVISEDGSGFRVEQGGKIWLFDANTNPIVPFENVQSFY